MVSWLPEHDEFLRLYWKQLDVDVLAGSVGHTVPAVLRRASQLGLRGYGCMVRVDRDEEYMRKVRGELL